MGWISSYIIWRELPRRSCDFGWTRRKIPQKLYSDNPDTVTNKDRHLRNQFLENLCDQQLKCDIMRYKALGKRLLSEILPAYQRRTPLLGGWGQYTPLGELHCVKPILRTRQTAAR